MVKRVLQQAPGRIFSQEKKGLLVLDSMRVHITDSVRGNQENKLNSSCNSWRYNKVFAVT